MRCNIAFCYAGVLLLLFLSVGCKETSKSNENQSTGFLEGTVTIGPLCPVEPCNLTTQQLTDAYAARKVIVYNSERTSAIKELSLDQTGWFHAELVEGTYLVDINNTGIDRSTEVPTTIRIKVGETITLNISIDTGIR